MIKYVWDAKTCLGEAPFWSVEEETLYWVDIDGKSILRYNPGSGDCDIIPQDYEFGSIVKRCQGGFIGGTNKGIVLLNENLKNANIITDPESDLSNNRFNDGKCDRQGRYWVGSTDINETEPTGALYCLNASHQVNCQLSEIIVSNGLGWSPDNQTMYFTDSGHQTIYAFDYDIQTGSIANRRDFIEVDPKNGIPDGLTVDSEGYVWSAHWNGSRITRYDPNGQIERVIDMPVPNVTSLAFGGKHLNHLYVTTARLGMTEDQIKAAPLSGGLFLLEVNCEGLPETSFAG